MTETHGRRIMVVFAHPDDAEFTCSGSVAQWIADGDEVVYVACTSGDKGSQDRDINPAQLMLIREQEQRDAAAVLGVKEVVFLRHKDGELEPDMSFRSELSLVLRHHRPQVVITHDPWLRYMIHPDHRAVGTATMDAVAAARDHLYFNYQLFNGIEPQRVKEILLFSPESPNFWVDITSTFDKKLEALHKHVCQVSKSVDLDQRMRLRAEEAGKTQGMPLAEAFHLMELR